MFMKISMGGHAVQGDGAERHSKLQLNCALQAGGNLLGQVTGTRLVGQSVHLCRPSRLPGQCVNELYLDAQYAIRFADASKQECVRVHRSTERTDVKVVVAGCVLGIATHAKRIGILKACAKRVRNGLSSFVDPRVRAHVDERQDRNGQCSFFDHFLHSSA